MDYGAELRYYEILFIKTINQFHNYYTLSKLTQFIEMISFISDANTSLVIEAMKQVLTNQPSVRIQREEYIICLKLFSGLNDVAIRKIAKCSPNTIQNCMRTYEDENIYIQNKLELMQSNEVRKVMKNLRAINEIY